MLSLEKLNDYIERLGLTRVEIAKQYIKDDGKVASRQYIGQLLLGTQEIGKDGYKKLVDAINKAQMIKKKEIYDKALDIAEVESVKG